MRGVDHTLKRAPAGPTEALEAGELRLDRDARRPGRLDQRTAVRENGVGGGLGGRTFALPRPPLEPVRIRIEPETDLAAALLDERRQPVGKCGAQSRLRRP